MRIVVDDFHFRFYRLVVAALICAQKKRTSDQHANKTFNRHGSYANNALLRSRISAVSCQSNSTAVCRVAHYIETEAPERLLIECVL